MERLLARKIAAWVFLLFLVLVIIGTVGFGALVRNSALGNDRFGIAGEIALNIASIPATIRKLMQADRDRMIARTNPNELRHANRQGWYLSSETKPTEIDGYLLLSRYDNDTRRHITEMVDLATLKVSHTWRPDSVALFGGLTFGKEYENQPFDGELFRVIHPYLLENGDIIVKDMYSPLARVDACDAEVWIKEGTFHHSTETGVDGTIWIPANLDVGELQNVRSSYFDDALVQISEDGEVLYSKSLTQILIENGYEYLLTGMNAGFSDEPIHLNDIEPVLEDGAFWKRGDVFLSFRHKSTIALFRPSTNEILWLQSGPWSFQHDVDLLSDEKIALYNNNTYSRPRGPSVDPINEVMIYDFTTDSLSSPYLEIMKEHDIRTISEGLFTFLPDGHLMVEESDYGRILFLAPNGEITMEYVNGHENGIPYKLGWVRYISREYGDAVLSNIVRKNCSG